MVKIELKSTSSTCIVNWTFTINLCFELLLLVVDVIVKDVGFISNITTKKLCVIKSYYIPSLLSWFDNRMGLGTFNYRK